RRRFSRRAGAHLALARNDLRPLFLERDGPLGVDRLNGAIDLVEVEVGRDAYARVARSDDLSDEILRLRLQVRLDLSPQSELALRQTRHLARLDRGGQQPARVVEDRDLVAVE